MVRKSRVVKERLEYIEDHGSDKGYVPREEWIDPGM